MRVAGRCPVGHGSCVLVVLTREAGRNSQLREWIGPEVHVVEVPLTMTAFRPLADVVADVRELEHHGSFRSLVVTSARTSAYLDAAVASLADDAKIFSAGPATTQSLRERGLLVECEATGRSLELAASITRGPVLMVGAGAMRDELFRALVARGLVVHRVVCYDTQPVTVSDEQREVLQRADVLFVGAPSAWSVARDWTAPSTWVIVPGPTTGDVVRLDHARVLEGWGPRVGEQLAALAR